MTFRNQPPTYEHLKAGDIFQIDGDQWFVQASDYRPAGFNQFEGAYKEYQTDTLGLSLLRVNEGVIVHESELGAKE